MAHPEVADSTRKPCLEFSSGDTVDIEMKVIGRRCIFPGNFRFHTFHQPFIVPLNLFTPPSNILEEETPPLNTWTIPS